MPVAKRQNWTREELILALNLYLQLPFGKLHKGNLEIIHLAKIIGRTADAVAMRLNNFASVDPYHQRRGIKGLTGGINQVQPIWDEFIQHKEDLIFESEKILAKREDRTVEEKYSSILGDVKDLKGEAKLRMVEVRVNQSVFRRIVLANYSSKCAITGIDVPELLVASHIIPWGKNEKERLNPQNGLCMNAIHDKAYDKGLITVTSDYKVKISKSLEKRSANPMLANFFMNFNGKLINLPHKFLPEKSFLEYHYNNIFLK